jgi:hypothetical protein
MLWLAILVGMGAFKLNLTAQQAIWSPVNVDV